MKKYLIYKFTSPSEKSYIGQTCDLKRRIRQHKNAKCSPIFANAINKYGFEAFALEILEDELTLEEANLFEELYITEHNTLTPNGYNLKSGGANNFHSEETKEKIRQSKIGVKRSKESCEKQSQSIMGENNPNYGNHLSDENKRKIGNPKIGKHPSNDTLNKLSIASSGDNNPMYGLKGEDHPAYGRIHTEEELLKMSEAKKGEKNYLFGKFGEDNPKSKKYIVTFPDGHEEIIIGLSEFCRNNNLSISGMSNIATGRYKKYKNFKCRYATAEEILDNISK